MARAELAEEAGVEIGGDDDGDDGSRFASGFCCDCWCAGLAPCRLRDLYQVATCVELWTDAVDVGPLRAGVAALPHSS